ncbi:MAG TPA: DUF1501 domain-containing protein [Chthoniobacteraceae bacterium]|jgi:hypothetical protein|nr:DUF1501 domain-containing protein [Chthoniobacteraceae bacterium]
MTPRQERAAYLTRRQFFSKSAVGLGTAALASLLNRDLFAAPSNLPGNKGPRGLPGLPHFAPKAKRVIYLLQNGAPPHIDMFDWKPGMEKLRGQEIPASILGDKRFSTMTSGQKQKLVLPAFTGFKQHGKSGAWLGDFLPHMGSIADDLCFVKSMHTEAINHAPAITFFLTGSEQPGRPSMGAWSTYGLGAETEELPAFVVMTSRDKESSCGQIFYDFYWGSGFLPSKFQGVRFRGSGDPVLYLSNPEGMSREVRRGLLDDLAKLNEQHYQEFADPEIATRIAQYEMAYKMQASVPELTDFSQESAETLASYGPEVQRQGSFAYNCLMARRLVERGVRFVQCFHAGWDHHSNLSTQFKIQCQDTDQPSAALVKDLKQRGLLEDTLVIWGGEFGRTPFLQGDIKDTKKWGRDHHPYAFTIWLAGAGVKAGLSFGETDEFGFNVVKDPVHVHDFQATVMHLLGIDHERLTFRFQGRQYRLTDVHGKVVKPILA